MNHDRDLRDLAARQFGLVRADQARALGVTRSQLRRLADRGWSRVAPSVFAVCGAPVTDAQRALVAIWAHGDFAALARISAAAWWDLPGFGLDPIEVIRRRDATERGMSQVHESRILAPHHIVERNGIPVTSPSRTIFDLAAVCHPGRVERALDTFWARRLVTYESLEMVVDELGRRGRTGTTLMRRLLADRHDEYRAPESGLEARFVALVEEAGDEPFERQVVLGDDDGPIGRVDFVDRCRRLVVETDSLRFHSSPSDRANDERRDARLRAIGYQVQRVGEVELVSRPRDVLETVRSARTDAGERLAS